MENARNENAGGFLGFLMKFCTKRAHADELLDGILHCNRVASFRDLGDPHRGDQSEGSRVMEEGVLTLTNEQTGESTTLNVVQARFHYPEVDHLALFCTSLLRSERYDSPRPEMINEFRARLRASLPTFVEMGKHAVVIQDVDGFLNRVQAVTAEARLSSWANTVTYYDAYPNRLHVLPSESVEPLFHKHESFRLQREHRIVVRPTTEGFEPLQLDIGSIRDMASYKRTEELLEALQIRYIEHDRER